MVSIREFYFEVLPLWKWILELILGSLVFAILYGLGMGLLSIPQPTAKCVAILIAGVAILALFPLWIKLFEKQWRWDLLTRQAGKNLFCGITIGFPFFVVLSGILYVTGCYRAHYASPHWSCILVNLCFYFLVACVEEVIFRGIIFRLIDNRFGLWWALGISALIFGFVHMINPSASIWSSVAIAIEAGVLLGVAYKYSNSDSHTIRPGYHHRRLIRSRGFNRRADPGSHPFRLLSVENLEKIIS